MRQATSKSGYLDVKLPAKARGKGPRAWKAWKRRWIVLHGLHDLATGGTIVTLDMYQNASVEGQQLERSTIYLESVTLVQRATSRSHPYTFCIEARQTVVYLAASCESDTQEWMDVFRNVLWPTVLKQDYISGFNELYLVAVIDPTFSSLFGVRGGSCHLIIAENTLHLRCNHTGHVLLEWPLNALARVYLAHAVELKDQYRIFIIEPRPHCGGWTAPLNLFSSKAQEIVRHMNACMRSTNQDANPEGANVLRTLSRGRMMPKWNPLTAGNSSLNISTEDIASVNSEILSSNLYDSPKMTLSSRDFSNDFVYQTPPKQTKFVIEPISEVLRESYYDQPRRYSEADQQLEAKPWRETAQKFRRQFSHSETDLNKFKISTATRVTSQSCSTISVDKELTSSCISAEEVKLRTKPSRLIAAEKFMSICSSISSRDSGVQMCSPYENTEKINEIQPENCEESVNRPSNEDSEINNQEETISIYENYALQSESKENNEEENSCKSINEMCISVNENDMEIYYEIDTDENSIHVEPMYEDLDQFRKDINKLLGIPISAGQNLVSGIKKDEVPPPLPPRCSRFGTKQRGSLRKKDVVQFLGIDDPLDREIIRTRQSSFSLANEGVRRKNLFRYLGVNNSTLSLTDDPNTCVVRNNSPQINSFENTYDVPLHQDKKTEKTTLKHRESKSRKFLKLFKEKDDNLSISDNEHINTNKHSLTNTSHLSASLSFKDCTILNNTLSSSQSVSEVNSSIPIQTHHSLTNTANILNTDSQTTKTLNDLYCADKDNFNEEEGSDIPVAETNVFLNQNLNLKIYEELATRILQEIWSTIDKEFKTTPKILILFSELEDDTEPLHNNYCNQENDNDTNNISIPVDSHYMEMTYKCRESDVNKEPMYQSMFFRSISHSLSISLESEKLNPEKEFFDKHTHELNISEEENSLSENKGNDSTSASGNYVVKGNTKSGTNNLISKKSNPNLLKINDILQVTNIDDKEDPESIYINIKKASKINVEAMLQFETEEDDSSFKINEKLYTEDGYKTNIDKIILGPNQKQCHKKPHRDNFLQGGDIYEYCRNILEEIIEKINTNNMFSTELIDLTDKDEESFGNEKNNYVVSDITQDLISENNGLANFEYDSFSPPVRESNMTFRENYAGEKTEKNILMEDVFHTVIFNNSCVNNTLYDQCKYQKLLDSESNILEQEGLYEPPLEPSYLLAHQCSLLNNLSVANVFESIDSMCRDTKNQEITLKNESSLNKQEKALTNQADKSLDDFDFLSSIQECTHSNEASQVDNISTSNDELPTFAALLLQWKRNSISAQQNTSKITKNDK